MILAALLFLLAGLGLAAVAIADRNIAAGLFAAGCLLLAQEAAWLAFVMWRERRFVRNALKDRNAP